MIKILHYGLSSNRGGIETYLYKVYSEIDRSKFHFDFIDMTANKPCFFKEFSKMGSHFYKITPRKESILKYQMELNKLFKENKPDIFHCHLNTLSDITPVLIALKHNCKVIVHSRSSQAPKSVITKILHSLNSLRIPKNKITKIAVSKKAGIWLFGKNSDYHVINNGIDIAKFSYNKDMRKKWRDKLKFQDDLVIGHVGGLVEVKNHEFLLKVFNEILKLKHNAKLLLIGDGPLKNNLLERINEMGLANKVILLGSREDVSDILNAMDLFIFPSIYEGFGSAILEAQTSGLPCLISESIPSDVVIADDCIQKSLEEDAKEWALKAIELSNEKKRSKGQEIIEEQGYSVETEIKKIEKIYTTI